MLSSFLARLSEKASLSQHYANHSIRATCITKLLAGGAPDSVTMATSRHRSVESLKIYIRPTLLQARRTAALLDDFEDGCADINQALASRRQKS